MIGNKHHKLLPKVSILTATLNPNLKIFRLSLESIKNQDYPKNLIQQIIMDGGSNNGAIDLARLYKCKIMVRPDLGLESEGGHTRIVQGIKMATGSIILLLESDNILTSRKWVKELIIPFLENKEVFCTYSMHNSYKANMNITTRYCALFGSPDPTLYYLKKTEKIRLDQESYDKGKIIKSYKKYYVARFNNKNLPTLGDNGHMILKSVLVKVISNLDEYIHVDAFQQLLSLGYDTFGVVKNSIIHVQNPNLIDLVKRRIEVKKIFYDQKKKKRKYLVFNPSSKKDIINLVKYVIFSLTLIVTIFESVRGYLKIQDKAWFLHPVLCIMFVFGYGFSELENKTKLLFNTKI